MNPWPLSRCLSWGSRRSHRTALPRAADRPGAPRARSGHRCQPTSRTKFISHPGAEPSLTAFRVESDSLGQVEVPSAKLWGAQSQRSLEHFSIGKDLMPREMITAYAILKRSAAAANHGGGRLNEQA